MCCGGDIGPYCSLGGRVQLSRLINQCNHLSLKPAEDRKRIEFIAQPQKKLLTVEMRCGGDTFLEQKLGCPSQGLITQL